MPNTCPPSNHAHYLSNVLVLHLNHARRYQSNLYREDTDYMQTVGNRWALGFVGLGLCALLGNIILSTGFAVAGERMTRSLRTMAFEAMVRKGRASECPASCSGLYLRV